MMSAEEIAALEQAVLELRRSTKRPVHKQAHGKGSRRKHERKRRKRRLPPEVVKPPADVQVVEFDIPLVKPEGWVRRRRGKSMAHAAAELERQRAMLREVERRRAELLRGSSPF